MGGRGAAREREYYRGRGGRLFRYGEEFRTLFQQGRIKFVTTREGNVTSPMETRTEGRIYVTVTQKGKLQCITFYSKNGRKKAQIDLLHEHNGKRPHKHIGYEHTKDGIMTRKDSALVEYIEKIWKEKTGK